MASDISSIYIDQFGKDLVHVSQQKKSRLFSTISQQNMTAVSGENFSFELMGKAPAMTKNNGLYSSTVYKYNTYTRIWGLTEPFEWDTQVSKTEVARIGRDPKSKIVQSAGFARGRLIDTVITLALGAATTKQGTKQATASDIAFAGTTIDIDLGSSDGLTPINLTVEKLRAINLEFNKAEVDPSLKRYIVVTSEELDFLAEGADIRSKDYEQITKIINNTSKEDIQYMGLYWRVIENLPVDTLVRTCYAYTEDALCFGNQTAVEVNMEKASQVKFNWVMRLDQDLGCVRVQDDHVVWVPTATADADNTPAIANTH